MSETPETPGKPEVPDFAPTDEELKAIPPRFNVERIPDQIVQQTFEQWDESQERMVIRARGTARQFSIGHNFLVHIEKGRKFQDPKDQDEKVTWLLKQKAFLVLTKNGVNPDRFSPELGIFKVSVPRFCKKDEARMKVVLAVRAMISAICEQG